MSSQIYLCVPFSEKDEAKNMGARWDNHKRMWYAPSKNCKKLLSRFQEYRPLILDGENPDFGDNLLKVDLIPATSWYRNVRSAVSEADWERIRKFVCERSKFKCELCRKSCSRYAHVHERFSYDFQTGVQKLERLLCICEDCHRTIHYGKAKIDHLEKEAKDHLKKVRGFTDQETEEHIHNSFEQWSQKNNIKWKIDLSILNNNGFDIKQV